MMNAAGFLHRVAKRATSSAGDSIHEPKSQSRLLTVPTSTKPASGQGLQTAVVFLSDGKQISEIYPLLHRTQLYSEDSPGTDNPNISFSTVSSADSAETAPARPTVSSASPSVTPENAIQATSTSSVTPTSQSNNNKGLIAGLAILAVLLALSIGTIVFILFRKRRRENSIEHVEQPAIVPPKNEYTTSREPSVSSLETSIAVLERQLHAKDSELRSHKAALLETGKRASTINLSDHQIHIRFARLIDAIGDWVMRGFENFEPATSPSAEVTTLLQRISTSCDTLLQDPDTQHLVLRAMVADVIAQAFVTDQFFGDVAFAELKHAMSANASPTDLNEWRALTIRMLSKTVAFQADRNATIEDITRKIDHLVSSLAQRRRSKQRVAGLQDIVEWASNLALDLAIQRALIKVERPGAGLGTFDPESMVILKDEISGDGKDPEVEMDDLGSKEHRGKPVRLCVFPAVVRWGNERGVGYEREHLVCKAQVLL